MDHLTGLGLTWSYYWNLWHIGLGLEKHLDYRRAIGSILLYIGLEMRDEIWQEVPLEKYEDFPELSDKQLVKQLSSNLLQFWSPQFGTLHCFSTGPSHHKKNKTWQYSKRGIRIASRVTKPRAEDLRKLGNIEKISNFTGDISKRPFSLPEVKLWQQQSKKHIKRNIKLYFSCPILLDFSTLVKYSVQDCSSDNMWYVKSQNWCSQ